MDRRVALIKGNKLVQKQEKKKQPKLNKDNDPAYPYLGKSRFGIFMKIAPFFHFLFKAIFHSSFVFGLITVMGLIYAWEIGYIPFYIVILVASIFPVSYFLHKKIFRNEGKLRYFLIDGLEWWETATLLSPKNPSPGLKVVGTHLVTSRYLAVPGPESSHNGLTKKLIPAHCAFFMLPLMGLYMLGEEVEYFIIIDPVFHLAISVIWTLVAWSFAFYYMHKPLGQPRRFFIFDRKKQTLSYHPSFFSRKMVTQPWVEFEGRAVWEYRFGYSCKLIHAPTGNMLELQGPDLHWNNAGAVEAYSYVSRFMDLSQPLADKKEFERYLPEKENLDHLSTNEYFAYMDNKDKESAERRKKYHNPPADTVLSKIGSFERAVKEYPWLSAKNIWNAAHRYNREPNWDKWVRDKWGIAANEEYQVPDNEKVGEPEWFNDFYQFLKSNRSKIKYMDDDKRIKFTQDWFEETFPQLHWVDPITADKYDQEETFS